MRMPGHNVHEILQLDPAHILQSEELGSCFPVERDHIVPRDVQRRALGLRHLVAALPPERHALVQGGGAAGPGGVWEHALIQGTTERRD